MSEKAGKRRKETACLQSEPSKSARIRAVLVSFSFIGRSEKEFSSSTQLASIHHKQIKRNQSRVNRAHLERTHSQSENTLNSPFRFSENWSQVSSQIRRVNKSTGEDGDSDAEG